MFWTSSVSSEAPQIRRINMVIIAWVLVIYAKMLPTMLSEMVSFHSSNEYYSQQSWFQQY